MFASLPLEAVISAKDVDNIYKVPLWYEDEGVDDFICEHFGMEPEPADLSEWREICERAGAAEETVKIALVGKYIALEDAYKSVSESLAHAGFLHGAKIEIDWVDSEHLSDDAAAMDRLAGADGILIPGGFGGRGIEGKIRAAQVAREQRIPYLGICLGMQIAVCEFARNVAGMDGANSTEFDPETPFPVIDLLPEQKEVADLGGTMRLGADPVKLHPGTRARALLRRRGRHLRAAPPPLRGEHPAALQDGGRRPRRLRHLARRPSRRGHRAARPPVLRASQYPPRVQVAARAPGPLFREFVGRRWSGRAARRRPRRATPRPSVAELVASSV